MDGDESASRADGCRDGVDTRYTTWQSRSDDPGRTLTPDESTSCCRYDSSPNGSNGSRGTNLTICKEHSESGAGHQHDHHHVRENGKTQKMQAGDAQEEGSRDNGLSRVETKIHGHGHAHGHSYSCQQSEALVDTLGASGSISQSTTSKDGQQVHASAKETPVATQESPCTHDHAHGHAHVHSHSHHDKDPDVPAPTVCLAVIQENGMDVVLLDATGVPRVFRYPGVDVRQLCFDPHGSADGSLLTPCLDQEGKHGVPEDSCFCGVETPHMHAHLKAAACDDACADPTQLATHTLYPNQETTPTKSKHVQSTNPVLNIQVSERMPKECNSTAIQSQHSSHGRWRRVHPVQHEDHVDFLVHDTVSGDLHLEHPCHGCGGDDVHGRFERVGQRHWRNVTVQFFQVASAKFNIQDFRNIFSVESDRVKAVENLMDAGTSRNQRNSPFFVTTLPQATSLAMARSVIACSQICCASEIPIINNILEPMAGVTRVRVNVPLKQVLIDHDAKIVPAATMERALNKQGLGASILRDGTFTTAATSKPKTTGASVKSTFYVAHICCASEIPAINQVVEPLSGVLAVSINVTSKMVYVTHDTTSIAASQICAVLNEQGFGAEVKSDGGENFIGSLFCESTLTFQMDDSGPKDYTTILTSFLREYFDPSQIQMESFVLNVPQQQIKVVPNPFSVSASSIAETLQAKTGIRATVLQDGAAPSSFDWSTLDFLDNVSVDNAEEESVNYPKPAITLSGICWLLSMLSLLGGQLDILKYVGLAAVAFGLPTISGKAFRTLSRWQFDTNCLMFLAAMGAVVLQEYTEAAAVVFLFAISEWLEVRATARARHALSAIVHLRPEKANLVHPQTRQLVVIPASAVPVGALVSVKTGDKIPCDGIVVEGITTVDESSLTGEARPIRKGLHDVVSGGTVNSGMAQIMVRTTSTSENSAVSRLIRLVEEAQANRSDTEKLVDEFAKIYTPFVVLVAVLMCSVPWAFGQETGRTWTENGLILIVVACPCAMIISTPVSYVAGLAATAQNGILIKGGAHLEALSLVKHICFDKTGTLTNGEFALLSLEDFAKNMSRKEVFEHLALMEERASHPVAQAILTGARNEKVSIPKDTELERHTIIAGEGVLGIINGREVHVGNERMFGRIGLLKDVPERVRAKVESWKGLGGTIGYMSVEGEGIVCAYCAADGVRAESASVVSRLRKCGIEVTMLTGDNRDAALAVGAQVGLSEQEIQSKLLPEEKLAFIESLSSGRTGGSILSNPCGQRRLVMMCGDGVNDAPALASADIGVAMGAGAALAMETADVALLDSNLEKLEYSIRMGQRVTRKIKENVAFSLTVKFVVLGFALAGLTHLWAAIASDVGAMILVTLNAMLLLPKRQREEAFKRKEGDIEQGRAKIKRQDSHSTLPDDAAQGPGEVKVYKVPCEKGCCETETKARAVSHTACQKNCFDTEKTAPAASQVAFQKGYRKAEKKAATTAVSLAACPEGCCDTEKATTAAIRHAACPEGCCDTEKATTAALRQAACQKGCGNTEEDATAAVRQAACQKGCGNTEEAAAVRQAACQKGCCDTEKASTTAVSQAACAEGCCDTEKATTAAVRQAACQKGCCNTEKATTAALRQAACQKGCGNTEKATTAAIRQAACQKGCCDTEKAATAVANQASCKEGCCDSRPVVPVIDNCCGSKVTKGAEAKQLSVTEKCCSDSKSFNVENDNLKKGCGGSHLLACKSFENSDYSSGHIHAHPHKSVVRMT